MKASEIVIGQEYVTWTSNDTYYEYASRVRVTGQKEVEGRYSWKPGKTVWTVEILDKEGRVNSESTRESRQIKMTYEDWKAERRERGLRRKAREEAERSAAQAAAARNEVVLAAIRAKVPTYGVGNFGNPEEDNYDVAELRRGEAPNWRSHPHQREVWLISTEELAALLGVSLPPKEKEA